MTSFEGDITIHYGSIIIHQWVDDVDVFIRMSDPEIVSERSAGRVLEAASDLAEAIERYVLRRKRGDETTKHRLG